MRHFTFQTIFGENENCFLKVGRYEDTKALKIVIADEKGNIARATINTGLDLAIDEAVIKTYTENEGLLDQMYSLGFIEEVLYWIEVGYARVPVVRVNLEWIREFDKQMEFETALDNTI